MRPSNAEVAELVADLTDEQNAKYADTWAKASTVGRHAVQAENRRSAA